MIYLAQQVQYPLRLIRRSILKNCPKCNWQNADDAVKCANCFQDLQAQGAQAPGQAGVGVPPSYPAQPTQQFQAPQPPPPGYGQQYPGQQYPGQYPAGYPGAVPPIPYMEYVGFWPRVGGALIDGILLGVGAGIILAMFGVTPTAWMEAVQSSMRNAQSAPPGAPPDMSAFHALQAKMVPANALTTAIQFVYYVGLLGAVGATVGKMAIGAKVVKMDGSPIGFGVAAGRVILEWIFASCTCGLIYLVVAFTEKKQGVHDLIMGTVVIRNR